jgi:hypothetical protein
MFRLLFRRLFLSVPDNRNQISKCIVHGVVVGEILGDIGIDDDDIGWCPKAMLDINT